MLVLQHLSSSDFGRKARSWFEAFLNNYLGCRHVARVIIQYGVTQPAVLTHLIEAIQKEKAQEREDAEEAHGAEEPVRRLRKAAHDARDALRSARSLSKKVEEGKVPFDALTPEQPTPGSSIKEAADGLAGVRQRAKPTQRAKEESKMEN